MMMSFRDDRARLLLDGIVPKTMPMVLAKVARRKLEMINAAKALNDLRGGSGKLNTYDKWNFCLKAA